MTSPRKSRDPAPFAPPPNSSTAASMRSQFEETSEALFLTQGYLYDTMEQAEARFKGEDAGLHLFALLQPDRRMFERRMALLEGAEAARATASGMAAVTASLMGQLKAGDHVVAARALFGSCLYVVEELLPRFGVASTLVEGADLDAWRAAMRPNTKTLSSRARPTRRWKSSTSPRSRRSPTRTARRWWSTTCSRRRCCRSRCSSAPIASSIPRPSTSTGRAARSAA